MKKLIGVASILLLYMAGMHAFSGKSFLLYRSQAVDSARSFAGWQQLWIDFLEGYYLGNLAITVDYTHSFDAKSLNCFLFGNQALTFTGSRVVNRLSTDILADYFGLPTDFKSTVSFKPVVKNIIVDFDWFTALHYICEGLYVRINTTLVHAEFDVRPCEYKQQPGILNYPAGYMSATRIDRRQLPYTALAALSGAVTFGDLSNPLAYGKITGKQTTTKLADIYGGIGYLFSYNDEYHVAGSIHVVVPTGTRSKSCFLFEPQVGNGRHWAVGIGINAHYDLLMCDAWNIGAYLNARMEHLCSSYQKRSFDLCNGPGSRYMLLQDMGAPLIGFMHGAHQAHGAVALGDQLVAHQYQGHIFNAINKTTFKTKIKVDVQADIALSLVLNYCAWNATFGYNLWARSREKIVCRDRLPAGRYAIKGDAQLYGYQQAMTNPNPLFVGLNATQHTATLHAGQGVGSASQTFSNANADNAVLATLFGQPLEQSTAQGLEGTGVTAVEQVHGSSPAILLSDADINACSGISPAGVSNSIFINLAYTWYDSCGAVPYCGIGSKIEFGSVDNCTRAAVSQWGLWLKGGVVY